MIKVGKASENSCHKILNLDDRTVTGRNQKISFQKEVRHGDKKSEYV